MNFVKKTVGCIVKTVNALLYPVVALLKIIMPPERKQVLLCGPDGSGKTTLLYRLKIPNWKFPEMAKDSVYDADFWVRREADPCYHYEEFTSAKENLSYALWDLPGGPAWHKLWSTFYRFMTVAAVVFIVDGNEEDPRKIEDGKAMFRQLLGEDELRDAAFCVIVNDKSEVRKDGTKKSYRNNKDDHWKYELGIAEDGHDARTIHRSMDSSVAYFVIDVKEVKGAEDLQWQKVLFHIKRCLQVKVAA